MAHLTGNMAFVNIGQLWIGILVFTYTIGLKLSIF